MKCTIHNSEYDFYKSYQKHDELRNSLNILAQKTFGGLSFDKWYHQGYWNENCVPYSLFENQKCLANIFVNIFHISVHHEKKRYVQLGTIMTDSEYRNKGLSRFLMGEVLNDWQNNCDALFLYANNAVVDFYPKFGFREEQEYQYSLPISKVTGNMRKLDIENDGDKKLLFEKCRFPNPFSSIKMLDSADLIMFHCIMFQKNNIYYVPKYDAVVVAEQDGEILFCLDIFCEEGNNFNDIVSIVANGNCNKTVLGFTPKDTCDYKVTLLKEDDTHLFVMQNKDSIFQRSKLMFPMLCRT